MSYPTKTRVCKECGERKPHEDFPEFHQRSNGKTYRRTICRVCKNVKTNNNTRKRRGNDPLELTRAKKAAEAREWKKKNPEAYKIQRLRVRAGRIGLNPDEIIEYYNSHDQKCEICGNTSTQELDLDHCHKTGKFRGLLCSRCNTSIGKFEDSPRLLMLAIDYLVTHQEP